MEEQKAIEIFKESGLSYMEFEQDGMRVTFDNRKNLSRSRRQSGNRVGNMLL